MVVDAVVETQLLRQPADDGNVLLCTYGSPGDLLPFLAIGLALREHGCRPTIGTSPSYRARVEALGLDFAPIRPDRQEDLPDPDFGERVVRGLQSPGDVFRRMFLPAFDEAVEDTLAAVAGADLVVAHTLAFAAGPAAEAKGVPWVSATLQPLSYFSLHDPPAIGPRPFAVALEAGGAAFATVAKGVAGLVLDHWSRPWHRMRDEIGLPESVGDPIFAGQHSPLLSLALFSSLMGGAQPDWPTNTIVTGFPFLDDPGAPPISPELEAFLEAGDPPIVFTLGTTAVREAGGFYEASAEAAARLGMRAVLLCGSDSRNRPTRLPPEVIAVDYAPHGRLFPRAAAVVHQGGVGTLAQTLRAGVPMVVVPFAHDQPDNAARMVRLGVARRIERHDYTVETAAHALRGVLGDETLRRRARELGQRIRLEDGAAVAAAAVARILGCG
ncbi:MAG: probable glucosyltransferase [uncultured Thermomicrobiales bacterium]|uniref:Probable glucosyltransferase n=1 Tax=uncultured Thermomicrobiales bacterium TaxID=1645740 RepID=A0A6J4U975_9BACT|nr:MAG: probable glucosyltransferase [uncultured Thermomicrobiales bacterium]